MLRLRRCPVLTPAQEQSGKGGSLATLRRESQSSYGTLV